MSLFSSIGSGLSNVFGFGDDKAKADAARAKLQQAIASGGLQAAAQFGQQGQALHDKAGNLVTGSNVGLDYGKVDADQAKLDAVKQHYLAQYADGGLAAQAAVQAQQAQRGLNTQGGFAGIRNDTLNSADTQAQVGQIAQNEISQAGDATNKLDAQKAAVALQRAVLAAQVSHANFVKNLSAQDVDFGLTNTQQNLANQAQHAANELAYQEGNTSLDYGNDQYKVGAQLTDFLVGAAAKGFGAVSSLSSAANAAQATATGAAPIGAPTVVPSYSGATAGYIQPAATIGRSAAGQVPYTPIFDTPPTLPNTAAFFNRGA